MSESGFGSLEHVPHAICAEAVGVDGSLLVTLGDDALWAHVAAVAAHSNIVVTLDDGALRDHGLACIEAAGRIAQRRTNSGENVSS